MSRISTVDESGGAEVVEAHVLFPRDCWAALERLAAMRQKTQSQALVEAVALAHYLDLELAAGSQLATRRLDGKVYVLHFPWLQAAGSSAIRGDVSVPPSTEMTSLTESELQELQRRLDAAREALARGGFAWPSPEEMSDEEEVLIREMRLDELRAEQEVQRIRNMQRVDAARREQEQGRTFWGRMWRRRGR